MTTYQVPMPRKNVSYRLDQRIIDEIQAVAQDQNTSATRWLENLLISSLKSAGRIPADFRPVGETRGGGKKATARVEARKAALEADEQPEGEA